MLFRSPTTGCTIQDLNNDFFTYTNAPNGFALLDEPWCPGISTPVKKSIGDVLTVQTSVEQLNTACQNPPNASIPVADFGIQINKLIGSTFFVPVVTNVSGGVGNLKFTIASFFSFKLLGLRFKNKFLAGTPPPCLPGKTCTQSTDFWPREDCNNSTNCVYGTFSRAVVPGADVSTDPNFPAVGAQAIQLLP